MKISLEKVLAEIRDSHRGFLFLFVWGLGAFIVVHGVGNQSLFKIAVLALFGLQLWFNYQNGRWMKLTTTVLCLFASWFFWPIVYLYGLWAFILSDQTDQNNYKSLSNCASQALLVLWLLQSTPQGSWCMLPVFAIFSFLSLCLLFAIVSKEFQFLLATACILMTGISLLMPHEPVQIVYNPKFAPGYRHGSVLAKILHGELKGPNNLTGKIAISSLIQNSGPNNSRNPIVLVDHDQYPNKNHAIVIEGNLIQPEPWYSNQFVGDQYLLASIAEDGQWVSHVGGRLAWRGKLFLAMKASTDIYPVIVRYGNITYINDSDAFVDRLANYQKTALTEIVYGNPTYRIINIIFLFGILLGRYRLLPILMAIIVCVFIALYLYRPVSGEVRIIGKVFSPHEPSKISGLMRSLVDADYPYVRGNKNCMLLAVDSDEKACAKPTEKVVIGCERASITIRNKHICIDQLPLGDVNNVVDARNVIVNGVSKGPCVRIDDTVILGTGSPAKQRWSIWLP